MQNPPYGYPPGAMPGAPPQAPPGYGAPPGAPPPWAAPQAPPAPQWGAPPGPPAGYPPPGYGAPPQAPAPQWGAPPQAPPGYGAPHGPPAAPQWGAPPGPPAAPAPQWGAPPGPPPGYGAPPGPPAWQAQAQQAPVAGGAGRWSGVADSQVFTKTQVFPLGNFLVKVDEVKAVISQNPRHVGALMVVVECEITASQDPTVPVGSKRASIINMAKFGNADFKAVLGAALGFTVDQFESAKLAEPQHLDQIFGVAPGTFAAMYQRQTDPRMTVGGVFSPVVAEYVTSPANPLKGRAMALQTAMNGKGTFTKHNWSPYRAA